MVFITKTIDFLGTLKGSNNAEKDDVGFATVADDVKHDGPSSRG